MRLQTGPFGSQLHAHEYREAGTPVIPTEAIGRRRILDIQLPQVGADVVSRLERHLLFEGDILFARRGAQATGLSAIVEKSHIGALCGTGAILLRVLRPTRVDPTYLSFALSDPSAFQWLRDNAVGAVMPNLNADVISRLEIPVPPLDEQRRIADILGALDDKIELNRRTNETLETMARTLFEAWMGRHVDTVQRHSVEKLSNDRVLRVGDGYRAKNSELGPGGLPFARAGNIDNGFSFQSAELLAPPGVAKAADKVSQPYDVVFTSKGTVGRFAFVDPRMPRFVYSPQLCFWRSTDHARLNPFVLHQWLQSRAFLGQVDQVKGQTDMAEYVSLRDQRRMVLEVPPARAHAEIAASLRPLQERVWLNVSENHSLTALRDALLPRLLSGELAVSEDSCVLVGAAP